MPGNCAGTVPPFGIIVTALSFNSDLDIVKDGHLDIVAKNAGQPVPTTDAYLSNLTATLGPVPTTDPPDYSHTWDHSTPCRFVWHILR